MTTDREVNHTFDRLVELDNLVIQIGQCGV